MSEDGVLSGLLLDGRDGVVEELNKASQNLLVLGENILVSLERVSGVGEERWDHLDHGDHALLTGIEGAQISSVWVDVLQDILDERVNKRVVSDLAVRVQLQVVDELSVGLVVQLVLVSLVVVDAQSDVLLVQSVSVLGNREGRVQDLVSDVSEVDTALAVLSGVVRSAYALEETRGGFDARAAVVALHSDD